NKLESGPHDSAETTITQPFSASEDITETAEVSTSSQGQLWPEISSHAAGLKIEDARDFLNLLLKILSR
ncbi:hypothetical protein ABTM70_19845, partial [Acinetobacter baumannii]